MTCMSLSGMPSPLGSTPACKRRAARRGSLAPGWSASRPCRRSCALPRLPAQATAAAAAAAAALMQGPKVHRTPPTHRSREEETRRRRRGRRTTRKKPARNVIPGQRILIGPGDAADERDGGHGRANPARAVGARETSLAVPREARPLPMLNLRSDSGPRAERALVANHRAKKRGGHRRGHHFGGQVRKW